jgi:hypothetical protein
MNNICKGVVFIFGEFGEDTPQSLGTYGLEASPNTSFLWGIGEELLPKSLKTVNQFHIPTTPHSSPKNQALWGGFKAIYSKGYKYFLPKLPKINI